MKTFAESKIEDCRKEAGLSVDNLTYELRKKGLIKTPQTIINWLSGVSCPNAKDLGIIAEFFKKPVDFFYSKT